MASAKVFGFEANGSVVDSTFLSTSEVDLGSLSISEAAAVRSFPFEIVAPETSSTRFEVCTSVTSSLEASVIPSINPLEVRPHGSKFFLFLEL